MKQILLLTCLLASLHQYADIITPPPTTSPQNFCNSAIVANLTANGINLLWYMNATDENFLSADTPLTSGTYYVSQTINNEESVRVPVEVTINQAPLIDELGEIYSCGTFTLTELSVGNYFGDENHSEPFFAGDEINSSQTMYVYGENECGSSLSAFYIIIESAPSLPADETVEACNSYLLPDFSEGGYYTESGGNGSFYSGGEQVDMSQILYKYISNSCGSAETEITITINAEPSVDYFDDVFSCNSYELPYLSSGNFYTQPNTGGAILYPGDLITTSQVIYMYAGNGCGEAQGSFYVDISTLENTVSLDGNTLTANQNNANYEWWDCNAETVIPGENGQSFTPSIAGLYSVSITSGSGECNVWSDCILYQPLSIDDSKLEKISFFPNPASSTIAIVNGQSQKINKVEIIDLSGKTVMQKNNPDNLINIQKLASGMYILKVSIGEQVLTQKLIKQ